MNWANRITIMRILLIPVFVTLMIYYGKSKLHGHENDQLRVAACLVFAVAAGSDALDGYIARRYKLKSTLGTFLDPLADKVLLISAIILLTIDYGSCFDSLPEWFAVTVIARDVLLAMGAVIVTMMAGEVTVRPRLSGKTSTVSQMLILGWTMLRIPIQPNPYEAVHAILFFIAETSTIISALWYVFDGSKQLRGFDNPIEPKK